MALQNFVDGGVPTIKAIFLNAIDAFYTTLFQSATTAAAARAAIGAVSNTNIDTPFDHGAVGDGTTDDTVAVQALFNAGHSICIPEGYTFKVTSQITMPSNTYVFGGGTIDGSSGSFDVLFATAKKYITIQGITIKCNPLNYCIRVKAVTQYVKVYGCHSVGGGLFASNDVNDTYSAQSSSTYCTDIVVSGNTGECVSPQVGASIGFIVIAYSQRVQVIGNTGTGHAFGIFTWGGNIGAQDAVANARKCFDVLIVGNNVAPTNGGIFMQVSDSCLAADNGVTNCVNDVGVDMESCFRCHFTGNRVSSSGNGFYFYGLNRDCSYDNNQIELVGSSTIMYQTDFAYSATYVGVGTNSIRNNKLVSKSHIATFNPGVFNELIVEGNTCQNIVGIGTASSGTSQGSLYQFRDNTCFYDFTPTQAALWEFGGIDNGLFTNAPTVPAAIIEGNKFINRTGSRIAKRVIDIEDCLSNCNVFVRGNSDWGFGTSLYLSTTVTGASRRIYQRDTITDATTRQSLNDTTEAIYLLENFTDIPYASGNFTGSASMTWTVDSGDQGNLQYKVVGDEITMLFEINTATVAGTPDNFLQIKIPAGLAAQETAHGWLGLADNGTPAYGEWSVANGGTVIRLQRNKAATVWTASTNTNAVYGEARFKVNP